MTVRSLLHSLFHWFGLLKVESATDGSNGTWEDYRLYALGFYVIPEAQQLYRAHIDKVINRVNTVTGIRYGDDPTVLAWELANEPITPAPYEWFDNTAA